MRVAAAMLLLVVQATVGCGSSPSPSVAPSPTPTPAPSPTPEVRLAVFSDPMSSFTTSDVRDAQRQIVRFNVANDSLIWAADGRSFPGFPVSGNFVRSDKNFQIGFGTEDGERRAYFTETATGTICDVEVVNNQLVISPTSMRVPGGG